jgi:hypothetical protein
MDLQAGVNLPIYNSKKLKTAFHRFVASFKINITSKLAFTSNTGYNSQYKFLSCIDPGSGIILPSNNHQSFPRLSGSPLAYDRLAFFAISRSECN